MIWIKLAASMMFLAVAFGAFGAHALRGKISDYYLEVYKTGVLYHMIHALGLFVVAWLTTVSTDPKVGFAGILMLSGIVIFSGSLYILSISGLKWLGAITPMGGVLFLVSWVFLVLVK